MNDYFQGPTAPASGAVAITPDATFSPPSRAIWVGTGGNVTVQFIDGSTATHLNVPSGFLLTVRATKIVAATTTASNLVAWI